MDYRTLAYSMQELGQRQNQEDSIYPPLSSTVVDGRLFIVCDGMGGHERGEVASRTVCDAMSRYISLRQAETFTDDVLLSALNVAYDALDALDGTSDEKKMGTTLAFLMLHDRGATVAHIGDSRVYHIRPADAHEPACILFKTCDHSLVCDLLRSGELTESEAKTFPQRNVITRAMMPHQERRAKADINHISDVRIGDIFFLCSDGVLENMEDWQLLSLLTSECTDAEKIEALRRATCGNRDNHSAFLVHIMDDTSRKSGFIGCVKRIFSL